MPSIDENRTQWSTYDWPEGGEEWSRSWGDPRLMWYGSIYPRIAAVTPAAHILEIAPGFGRCTQYLLGLCRRLTVVDLTEKCINTCQARFAEHSHIEYMVNDGRSLAFLDDASVDFVFSWDSLVHADADVCRAYVTQLGQKMAPGGLGSCITRTWRPTGTLAPERSRGRARTGGMEACRRNSSAQCARPRAFRCFLRRFWPGKRG